MEGRTPSSRRAKTLARIFASVSRREIGRNELHSRRFLPFLRITEITAWHMVRGKVLSESDSSKTDSSKGASWSENFLKKIRRIAIRPWGLAALHRSDCRYYLQGREVLLQCISYAWVYGWNM